MPNPMNDDKQTSVENPAEDPITAPTIEEGYCVKFYAYGDGSYGIGEPEPLTPEDDDDEGAHVADLTSALKRLLNVVKQNPVGSDEDAQFDAGYNPGAK